MNESIEEEQIAAFLAPLEKIQPAARRRRPRLRVGRLALVGAALLVVAGGAVAATQRFGVLRHGIISASPSRLHCAVIGRSSDHAAAYFTANGYRVLWHFETYHARYISKPHGRVPGAVEGFSKAFSGPPPDAIVSRVAPIGPKPKTLTVFTQASHDPNAPRVRRPPCH
jgi:hypothetical protein